MLRTYMSLLCILPYGVTVMEQCICKGRQTYSVFSYVMEAGYSCVLCISIAARPVHYNSLPVSLETGQFVLITPY